jgi:hypothetical protein
MSGQEEDDQASPPHHPLPSSTWSGLASISSAGGGRVEGSFLTEPGSYEGVSTSPCVLSAFRSERERLSSCLWGGGGRQELRKGRVEEGSSGRRGA